MVKKKNFVPERGDIVWLDFDPQTGKEQAKRNPALVLSPAHYNRYGLALCCPVTTKIKGYPFEVEFQDGKKKCAVLADHVKSLDWQARRAEFKSRAPETVRQKVARIIAALMVR